MKRFPNIAAFCVAASVAGLLTGLPAQLSANEGAQAPLAQDVVRPVISEIVSTAPSRARAFPGQVEPAHETALAFQTIGRLATLNVSPGDVVEKGEVLAALDRVSLQEDVRSAKAALASAEAQADFARQSYDRVQVLAQRDIASRADVEQAEANRNATAAQALAARAELASAEEALSYGTLTAPNAGIVLDTPIEQGTVVTSGTTVVTLADLEGQEAVIDVPREFLALLPEDAVFSLAHHAGEEPVATARLRLIEPVADDALRGRRLRLAIDDDSSFRLGSLVSATYSDESEQILTLPRSAITGTFDAPAVWRVTPDSRVVTRVPVTLGPVINKRVEIADGISVGDEIVVKGANSLVEGQEVGERLE